MRCWHNIETVGASRSDTSAAADGDNARETVKAEDGAAASKRRVLEPRTDAN
jgi:hypothetical protein